MPGPQTDDAEERKGHLPGRTRVSPSINVILYIANILIRLTEIKIIWLHCAMMTQKSIHSGCILGRLLTDVSQIPTDCFHAYENANLDC